MSAFVLDSISVLLLEDDDGDALLVADLLQESASNLRLVRSRTVAEALEVVSVGVDCVLLDLGLPDAEGLESLARVRAAAPGIAVIVLTGLDNEAAGAAAVAAGAQDYLVKGQVDGGLLARSIRYAIGRRQAEEARQKLHGAELRAAENARLERGLVPRPIVIDPAIWMASSYRPGRSRALLGGDFFDVVETADGKLHAVVGDVCGHGPDEAALGASLRIAWRALTLSGADADVAMATLHQVIEHERQIAGTFATLCTLEIEPARDAVSVRRAGHPPPVLIDGRTARMLPYDRGGPPIGVYPDATWPAARFALPAGWSILLYTDGLIEGCIDGGSQRLGEDGLHELIVEYLSLVPDLRGDPDRLLRRLIARATERNGEALTDDVAMLLIGSCDDRKGARGELPPR